MTSFAYESVARLRFESESPISLAVATTGFAIFGKSRSGSWEEKCEQTIAPTG